MRGKQPPKKRRQARSDTGDRLEALRQSLERRRAIAATSNLAAAEFDDLEDFASREGMTKSAVLRASFLMASKGLSWEEAKAKALESVLPALKVVDRAGVNSNRETREGEWLDVDLDTPERPPEKGPESNHTRTREKDWLTDAPSPDSRERTDWLDPRSFRARVARHGK